MMTPKKMPWYNILGMVMFFGPLGLGALAIVVYCLQHTPGEFLFITGFLTWMFVSVYLMEKS